MIRNRGEKGSVTLFVLVACMFMIIILLMVNVGVMNKNATQSKELDKIAKEYSQNEIDLDEAYAKAVDENQYVTAKDVQEMIDNNLLKQYPVGSIYISTNSQNPSEYIGGEWESFGEGRTLVGAGTGTDENNVQKVFEIEQTGGEYEHTLTIAEMPRHQHSIYRWLQGDSNSYAGEKMLAAQSNGQVEGDEGLTYFKGGDQPHNNIQPYIVTYMWKRVN